MHSWEILVLDFRTFVPSVLEGLKLENDRGCETYLTGSNNSAAAAIRPDFHAEYDEIDQDRLLALCTLVFASIQHLDELFFVPTEAR